MGRCAKEGETYSKAGCHRVRTDHESKDEYINYLPFLLEPHLSLLLTAVVEEIRNMPDKIGVIFTPLKCQAPKATEAEAGKVTKLYIFYPIFL